jgi:hypothetical protein
MGELNEKQISELQDLTNEQLRDRLTELEREEREMDLEIKREKVAEIRARRQALRDQARAKALSTAQFLAQREAAQKVCNHRKGGRGPDSVMRGQGDSAMYAVVKHMLPIGRPMVLCQRCGKEWHPEFRIAGEVVQQATPGYEDAINFPTDNTSSGASIFLFDKAH